jgi:hypothetical protein
MGTGFVRSFSAEMFRSAFDRIRQSRYRSGLHIWIYKTIFAECLDWVVTKLGTSVIRRVKRF